MRKNNLKAANNVKFYKHARGELAWSWIHGLTEKPFENQTLPSPLTWKPKFLLQMGVVGYMVGP